MLRKSLLDLMKGVLKAVSGCPFVNDVVERRGESLSMERLTSLGQAPHPPPCPAQPGPGGLLGCCKGPLPTSLQPSAFLAGRSQLPGLAV